MRRISRYQGAMTRSRLNRAVIARYFAFMIISNLIIFSLLGVVYSKWNVTLICHSYSVLTSPIIRRCCPGHCQGRRAQIRFRDFRLPEWWVISISWLLFVHYLIRTILSFRNPQRFVLHTAWSRTLKLTWLHFPSTDIQGTYVQQSTYWLTVFPLRGFLVIFEIVQLIKLLLLSVQRL